MVIEVGDLAREALQRIFFSNKLYLLNILSSKELSLKNMNPSMNTNEEPNTSTFFKLSFK